MGSRFWALPIARSSRPNNQLLLMDSIRSILRIVTASKKHPMTNENDQCNLSPLDWIAHARF